MKSGYDEVLNHLLFHKALEEDASGKIDRYLQMLERVKEGYTLLTDDPFERSVAAAFELVIEQSLDPWDIDLERFCKAYIQRLKALGSVNFITAGRIVLMAWSVLKLKTDALLSAAEPINPMVEVELDCWDIVGGPFQEPEDVDFTHRIMAAEEPPLKEALHREPQRPVTLLDLLEAFAEALEQASGAVSTPRRRRSRPLEKLRGKVHGEDLEEDIRRTWSLLESRSGEVVGLSELCNGDRWEHATVFLSLLFLAKMGWVEVWQDDFPWGEVYIRPLHVEVPGEVLLKEEAVT